MRQVFKNHHLGREFEFGRHKPVKEWVEEWKEFDPTL
jgi:hypothetical protein